MSRLTELIDIDGMKIKVPKERPLPERSLGAIIHKLYDLEDLMEKYEIENLVELEIALDQYYLRYDKVETRRVDNNDTVEEIKVLIAKANAYDTISEQLGCPLEVVFKALKEGFYTQNNHHTKQDNTWLGINDLGYCKEIFCMYFDENMANIVSCVEVDTRAYGKTWWLKGEKEHEED